MTGSLFEMPSSIFSSLILFYLCPSFTRGGWFDTLPEMCRSSWIHPDLEGLQNVISERVFGQPFVSRTVLSALNNHLSRSQPKKPLTISFHGPAGVGKNYVASLIAEKLFYYGYQSKFVHYLNGGALFHNPNKLNDYKDQIHSWVLTNISSCPNSLFIFDEVDKMVPGLFDGIKPLLDYQQFVKAADSRNAVFIFLSNIGGEEIQAKAIDLLKQGVDRNNFELGVFRKVLHAVSLTQGGFQDSSLLRSSLIDHHIPFLPLEVYHVKQCIKAELQMQGQVYNTDLLVRKVLEEVDIEQHGSVSISRFGCRHLNTDIAFNNEFQKTEL